MKNNRSTKILQILTESHRVEVAKLAETLGVSAVTVRKDLDALEKRGIIERERGYAVLKSTDDINGRLAVHFDAKRHIAQAAAALVGDAETVMVENGSCCTLVAEELTQADRDVKIITNSAFIANYVRQNAKAHVILLGGSYQNDSQVVVGPLLKTCAEQFLVDKLFIGADGFSVTQGFTNADLLRSAAVRDMAAQANQVIVVTESSKFGSLGVVPMGLKLGEQVKVVVTDDKVDRTIRQHLESRGVRVIAVSTDEE